MGYNYKSMIYSFKIIILFLYVLLLLFFFLKKIYKSYYFLIQWILLVRPSVIINTSYSTQHILNICILYINKKVAEQYAIIVILFYFYQISDGFFVYYFKDFFLYDTIW